MPTRHYVLLLCMLCLTSCIVDDFTPPDLPETLNNAVLVSAKQLENAASLDECFAQSYNNIVASSCSNLDEYDKRRLALAFAKCHLGIGGRDNLAGCAENIPLGMCIHGLSAESYSVFTVYTAHVDNLCYYLESRSWKQATSDLINRLAITSNDTAATLSVVISSSETLRKVNEMALLETKRALNRTGIMAHSIHNIQMRMASKQEQMHRALDSSLSNITLIRSVLYQLASYSATLLKAQAFITAELSTAYTVGFYALTMIVCWIMTAVHRLRSARLRVVTVVLACAVFETYFVRNWGDTILEIDRQLHENASLLQLLKEAGEDAGYVEVLTTFLQWIMRQMVQIFASIVSDVALFGSSWAFQQMIRSSMLILCICTLFHAGMTYKDYERENYALLLNIWARLTHSTNDNAALRHQEQPRIFDPSVLHKYFSLSQCRDKFLSTINPLDVDAIRMRYKATLNSHPNNAFTTLKDINRKKRYRTVHPRYDLRSSVEHVDNPILEEETANQFSQYVHLQSVLSSVKRFVEVTLPAEADDVLEDVAVAESEDPCNHYD